MAWRPHEYLLEGELDNTRPGRVTGWIRFAGMAQPAVFDLKGDFHRDIRGAKLHIRGNGRANDPEAAKYMKGFAGQQTGYAGDITAGLTPQDYTDYPYIEWYSDENGRVVLELEPSQVKVIGQPIPADRTKPLSRQEQAGHMAGFLTGMANALGVPAERAICVSDSPSSRQEHENSK